MAYYGGVSRQTGGGLGGIFKILTRSILPAIFKTARPFIQSQAKKALPKLAKAGLGLVSDLQNKKNFKQALKSRGKRLAGEMLGSVLNGGPPPTKRHKNSNRRRVNTSQRARKRRRRAPRDVFS